MTHDICEGIWIKRMPEELMVPIEHSIENLYDNKAAINIAKNPIYHDRTKHVEIDRYFIKEKIDHGVISITHVPS